MTRTVRAVGIAAAAFVLAAAFSGGPLQAWQGEAAPSAHYLDHAAAGPAISDLGLNGAEDGTTASASAQTAEYAEHLVALADAAMPRPRGLGELVDAYAQVQTANEEQDCLASAVYFEARGESLDGQLAVAEVVLNRASSGRYPATICGVVTQPWQFSFVNATGRIPAANRSSEAWSKAVAVARIAQAETARLLPRNVLWYHADYVSPSWGRRLARNAKIGLHIFYS